MKRFLRTAMACAACTAAALARAQPAPQDDTASTAPAWSFAVTAYPTDVRGGENYTSVVAAADRDALHLEARYNYESIGARSAFVGWTFAGGKQVTWSITPLVGGAWGDIRAFIPALEAAAAWGPFDCYVEAEYVRDNADRTGSYTYAWSELGWRPAEWLRVGLAAQRTRAYGGERDYQPGPFGQLTWGPVTLGGYWFNPGAHDQVFVGAVGVKF
jgi:hypothetical protein